MQSTPATRTIAALALALAAGCGGEPEWTYATPEVVGEEALAARLAPRDGEKLVLANFWASW
jgi:hypothetical protein